jgi:DNA polymerase-4
MRAVPTILHVDMDAFFASVEVLLDPSLAGKPVVVGGTGARGVVASCTYEARAFGVRSAMPTGRARRLCPQAVFVQGRYDVYSEHSRRIFDVFRSFTPLVEGISLDEAFLDVAGAQRLFGDPPAIARDIRARIENEIGLRCSVGVATSKLIAKLASEAAKPKASSRGVQPGAGVVVVDAGRELDFLHPLPVEALWGVGPATRARLERLGVRTIGDLSAVPEDTLVRSLGDAAGRHLHALSWARDDRVVDPGQDPKSISQEETFAHDRHDYESLRDEIVRQSDSVASRLRTHHLAGRTVSVKVRFHDFRTITRSHSVSGAIDTGPEIARIATSLLDQVDPTPGVRLLGVGVSGLTDGAARQLTFDDASGPDWEDASRAVDEVRRRFGDDAVGPATLVDRGTVRVKRAGEQQWGPAQS